MIIFAPMGLSASSISVKKTKEEKISFNCTSCGACCRRIWAVDNFPHPIREDGSCSMLTEDNKCSIYDKRPPVCRVSDMYEKHKKEYGVSRKEYYQINNLLCNEFIEEDGLDKKYLTNPNAYFEKEKIQNISEEKQSNT